MESNRKDQLQCDIDRSWLKRNLSHASQFITLPYRVGLQIKFSEFQNVLQSPSLHCEINHKQNRSKVAGTNLHID